jgi:regulator of replication initiation timing
MTNESKMLTMLESLTEDVGSIKQDVSGLKQEFSVMKEDISNLKQDASGLKEDNLSLKADNVSIKENQKAIFKELGRIRESVIRIENDQGYKINVLFDAFQSSQDANTETRQNVSILEKRVDKIELKVVELEAVELQA